MNVKPNTLLIYEIWYIDGTCAELNACYACNCFYVETLAADSRLVGDDPMLLCILF